MYVFNGKVIVVPLTCGNKICRFVLHDSKDEVNEWVVL